jgi:L-threonylcarbamoyladenylate synthase
MLASHYAPATPLRLDATHVTASEGLLLLGNQSIKGMAQTKAVFQLSAKGDLLEAAHNLYKGLRWLDRQQLGMIAVSPIPSGGLGDALRDRLQRAAAPR